MPYDSVQDAVKRHPNLGKYSAKAQRAFVSAFNSAFESGKDEGTCFAIAYAAANKVDGKTSAEHEWFDDRSQHDILHQLDDEPSWVEVTEHRDPWKSVKWAAAVELVRVANILSYVQEGKFKERREVESAARLMKLVMRKMEMPEAASAMNDIGVLAHGRGDVRDLPDIVLKNFNGFRGWGAGDFAVLYSELTKARVVREMALSAAVSDVVKRINESPLSPQDKSEMLRRPDKLSLPESGRLYRRVNFDREEQMFPGRRCRVDWKNHAKYRAELRGIDPDEMSHEVCDYIRERHFDKTNPKIEPPKPDNTRVKVPEGVAVVEYDARKDPVPVDVITTWASVGRIAANLSARLKKLIEDIVDDFIDFNRSNGTRRQALDTLKSMMMRGLYGLEAKEEYFRGMPDFRRALEYTLLRRLRLNEVVASSGVSGFEGLFRHILDDEDYVQTSDVEIDYTVEPAQHGGRWDESYGAYVDEVNIAGMVWLKIKLSRLGLSVGDLSESVSDLLSRKKRFEFSVESDFGDINVVGVLVRVKPSGSDVLFGFEKLTVADKSLKLLKKKIQRSEEER